MSSEEGGRKNPMERVVLDSVVVNIAVGESGERLVNAGKVLEELTGQKPSVRRAKKTIKSFKIRKGEPIAVMVTLRGERARSFLSRALEAVGRKIKRSSFSNTGVFSFGIKEHIDIPGTKYDPKVGIFGMDVSVNLRKPGYRVAKRRRKRGKVGSRQRVTVEEAIRFMVENFGVKVVEGE